jgi:hypothetical protein
LRSYVKNFNNYYQDHNEQKYTKQLPLIIAPQNQIVQANWQFPLLYVDRGLSYLPVGINQFWGSVYAASTYSTYYSSNGKKTQYYLGADITTRFIVGYDIPISLTVGATRGLARADNKVFVNVTINDIASIFNS